MQGDLAYGSRIYGFWGRHRRLFRASDHVVFLGRWAQIRERAVRELGLGEGDAALDLACGNGVNFELLERAVGPSGRLIALDYSEAMLGAAREHARAEGWRNLEFIQGDAAGTELPATSFDAALCTLGLSAIPDHEAAIARVRTALKEGGRFVVLDARQFEGAGRLLNPLIRPLFAYLANWDPEKDLVADLERAFEDVSVQRFNGGSLFIAVARKLPAPTGGRAP